jgi:hypothetical protein
MLFAPSVTQHLDEYIASEQRGQDLDRNIVYFEHDCCNTRPKASKRASERIKMLVVRSVRATLTSASLKLSRCSRFNSRVVQDVA